MIGIKLDRSLGDFQKYLEGIPKRIERNMLGAARQAGAYLQKATQNQFETQKQGWPPLKPKYAAWKAAHGFDSRILMRSHILAHSIRYRLTNFDGMNAAGEVSIPPGLSYPVMTNGSPYAVFKKTGRGEILSKEKAKKWTSSRRGKNSKRVSVEDVAEFHEMGFGRKRRPFFAPTATEEAQKVTGFFVRAMKEALRR